MKKVQLSVSAVDLNCINGFVGIKILGRDDLGVTEVAGDTSSPTWLKTFIFDYNEDTYTALNITVYGDDEEKIGICIFDASDFFGDTKGNVQSKTLEKGGVLMAHLTEYIENGTFKFRIEGKKLLDTDKFFFNKSDPYFVVKTEEGEEIYRSESLKDNLNPSWDEGEVGLSFCSGELDTEFFVSIYDKNSKGEDDDMGSFQTNINAMIAAAEGDGKDYNLTLNGKVTGAIYVRTAVLSGYQASCAAAGRNMSIVGASELCKAEFERKDEAAKAMAQAVIEAEVAACEAEAKAEAARASAEDARAAADAAKEASNAAAASANAM